ncbi:MAG TPA: hypothetical protein VIJ75_10295 [Hanamia sp.]
MKEIKLVISTLIFCVIFSCHSNDSRNVSHEETTDSTTSGDIQADSSMTVINSNMIWTVDDKSTEKEKLKAPNNAIPDSFSVAHVIQLLNQNFPDIRMELVKVSNDTAYVKIPDDKRLTQEIGNTGAENYLASATFTLTEMKNIRYVNILMEPGDHAEPGVYSREDFKRLR